MKIIAFCVVMSITITSCFIPEHEPTEKEKLEVFKAASFKSDILHNKSSYDAVVTTVFEKSDSILMDNRNIHHSKMLDSVLELIHTDKLAISKEIGNMEIRFDINRYKRQNEIIECHFLYWHNNVNISQRENFDLSKDTVLNSNYVYRIGVAKDNSGW